MEVSIQIEVRSTEIDVMGHVNNAKYLEYLEWGRRRMVQPRPITVRHPLDFTLHLISGPAGIILCPHRSSYRYNTPQLKKQS